MNKKHILTLTILFGVAFSFIVPQVSAQNGQFKEKMTEKKQELSTARSAHFKEVLERITQKFNKRLENYQNFLVKLEARKTKLSSEGKDVTKLTTTIQTAKTNFQSTKDTLAQFNFKVANLDYTKTVKELRSGISADIKAVRISFLTLHKSVSQAVIEIKELSL